MPKKILKGVVISDKMNKTRIVEVKRKVKHPLYEKVMNKSSKFFVHDEKNQSKIGDVVEIIESRPLSKNKRWRILKAVSDK